MTMDFGLDVLRTIGMRLVVSLTAVLAAVTGVLVLVLDAPGKWPAAVLAAAVTLYPVLLLLGRRTDAAARQMVSITVVALPALLLFVTEGQFWQTDLHLLFFATLAATSILCDWKALVSATLIVAVHHLGLGMLMPQWLFAGESTLPRILLHAVILAVEAGVLSWVAMRIVMLVEANAAQSAERERAATALAEERQTQSAAMSAITAQLGEGLTALAGGDLTSVIRADFPGGYAVLKTDYNSAVAGLREALVKVTESTESLRSGADEIAEATETLARGTESTAASLEQSSAALVQIDGRLKATTTESQSTLARADQAIATVATGRMTAEQAVEAMDRVSSSAKGIDSVIEGVDKIAFQTRVLAMNAAVEAGRAGDAGRGFAVVADLVSALAMRAEEEAKRARDQLSVTQSDIITAVSAVQRVDGSLLAIAGDVEKVHGLLGTIARDNQAQSLAITEISTAITSIDRTTQQNAAMVERTSAATRLLTAEVEGLSTAAGAFKVERRHMDVTPIRERRKSPPPRSPAATATAKPPAVPAATAIQRSTPRSAPRKLMAVSPVDSSDWSDF